MDPQNAQQLMIATRDNSEPQDFIGRAVGLAFDRNPLSTVMIIQSGKFKITIRAQDSLPYIFSMELITIVTLLSSKLSSSPRAEYMLALNIGKPQLCNMV